MSKGNSASIAQAAPSKPLSSEDLLGHRRTGPAVNLLYVHVNVHTDGDDLPKVRNWKWHH